MLRAVLLVGLVTLAPAPRAVAQESAAEQFARGVDYQHGAGVPRDARAAAEWYRKAAAQGHVQAQVNLAIMYLSGDGVEQDKTAAAEWFTRAAEQGDGGAGHAGADVRGR
jgi:uncharacterized protein